MYIRVHGGGCCGINHISGFGYWPDITEEGIREKTLQIREGMILEAVLTNAQCKGTGIAEKLQRCGFKLVSRFRNPNSGNICNVFHYTTQRREFKHLPFKIVEPE